MDPKNGPLFPQGQVRTRGNPGSHLWLCTNRTPARVRLRHEVRDLNGHPPMHPHLLHRLVEEVYSRDPAARRADHRGDES